MYQTKKIKKLNYFPIKKKKKQNKTLTLKIYQIY